MYRVVSSYSGKEKLSSIAASLWGAMEEGGKVSELRSQRWQWLQAVEAKETDSESNPKEANVSGWQWLAAETKATPSELTLKEVDLLPKVQHRLMQEVTFHEKLLPPSKKPLATATFDFVAQHREVTAAGDGKPNYSGAMIPLQNVILKH